MSKAAATIGDGSELRDGVAAQREGRLEAAEECYAALLAREPANADALYLLGTLRAAQSNPTAAAALMMRALRARPDFVGALQGLGKLQREAQRPAEAFVLLRRALDLRPGNAELEAELAVTLYDLGRPEEAVALFRHVLTQKPDDAAHLVQLGRALRAVGDLPSAEAAYTRALAVSPNEPAVHNNIGNIQFARGDAAGAIESYRRAIALRSDYADAYYNMGMAMLAAGQLPEGWRACRWRLRSDRAIRENGGTPPVIWDGTPLPGQVLLLHAEQGLGDTLQFCRYVPIAAARARIVLEVQAPLVRLLSGLPGVERVLAQGDPRPEAAAVCPLLSLPDVFGTTLETIPAKIPYLDPDAASVAAWRTRLDVLPGQKIGLVWAGNPGLGTTTLLDRRRSLRLASLAPLAEISGAVFVSLQKGEAAVEARTPPAGMALLDWTEELGDFADTAALVACLDLVIGVDTSVVHLAGALGRPVWLLNRQDTDWRWLLTGDASPWYPTMRIFRQTAWADWSGPVRQVVAALREFKPIAMPASIPDAMHPAITALLREGLALHQSGHSDEALKRYQDVLRLEPSQPDGLYLSGMVILARGKMEEGSRRLERAIELRPAFSSAIFNLGMARQMQQRHPEAVELFRRALALDPGMAEAHAGLGTSLHRMERMPEALASLRRAVELQPGHAAAQLTLGVVLQAMGHVEEAVSCYRRSLELRPDNVDGHNNLGVALADLHRLDEAIASYRRGLQVDPGHAQTHTNLGIALLQAGRYEAAWREWEWRTRTPQARKEDRGFIQREWNGGAIPGQVLLLHAEQGLGDTLMFCRFVREASQRAGCDVVLEVQPELTRLFAEPPGQLGPAKVVPRGAALPAFACHASLATLPAIFGTTLATIPDEFPYIHADPPSVERWRARLARLDGLKVGVVWAGNPGLGSAGHNPVDRRRSLPLARLAALGRISGVAVISLQKGAGAAQLQRLPAGMVLHDWTNELRDFADTAALVAALDLVVSVDTSVVHLAGALGKPVWLLNRYDPDWRWLLGREDCPWYPTLRQFRQPRPGDWDSVVAQVHEMLVRMVSGRPAEVLFEHANSRHRRGELGAAAASYRQAIALRSDHIGARANIGITLLSLGKPDEAERHLRVAVTGAPGSPQLLLRLGLALRAQGRADEALQVLRQAKALAPQDADIQTMLGATLGATGDLEAGIEAYRAAIALDPGNESGQANLAYALLQAGRMEEGWESFEWRPGGPRRTPPRPGDAAAWQGERIGGGVLLLEAEQGLGDTLHFCRYAPLAAVRAGCETVLRVPAPLVTLLGSLSGVRIVAWDDALPRHDRRCGLMSLPGIFGTTIDSIPADVPYLFADPARVASWRDQLNGLAGFRVGLAWAGNPRLGLSVMDATDRRRSIALPTLAPLGGIPGVDLVSLQVGAAGVAPRPTGMTLFDRTSTLRDFSDTAALVEALDIVICVNSAVVHLAGALGRPVWLLNRHDPDWRWLLKRDDSPWYPTLRQFRQRTPGDWEDVVVRVVAALTERVGGKKPLGQH